MRKTTRIRRLRDGEPIPEGQPRRYKTSAGYILLRWHIGEYEYLDVLEHRLIAGREQPHVHHINGERTDNRPENLMPLSALEHRSEHCVMDVHEAGRLYAGGWSLNDLARHYGVNNTAVMRRLKRRGVVMRTLSEARATWLRRHTTSDRGADGPLRYRETR